MTMYILTLYVQTPHPWTILYTDDLFLIDLQKMDIQKWILWKYHSSRNYLRLNKQQQNQVFTMLHTDSWVP